MISVVRSPSYLTVQDAGRMGHRRSGVPVGGAMDQYSLAVGNLLVGNDRSAGALEWALSGGAIRFEADVDFALTGATASATLALDPVDVNACITARAGEILEIERIVEGRFLYVCVAGGVDVPLVLGSRSTYLPAGFGGLHGRRLTDGDSLPIGAPRRPRVHAGVEPAFDPFASQAPFRIIRCGASARPTEAWQTLTSGEFRVSTQSDRTGYRLEGTRVPFSGERAGDSRPTCPGTIQLPPNGVPIVLLADGPTVGGYEQLAVMATADLSRFAQRNPGDSATFIEIGVAEARTLLAAREQTLRQLEDLTR